MSASLSGVVGLPLQPPGLRLFHHIPLLTATPSLTSSPTDAQSANSPRSLNTLTISPVFILRFSASITFNSSAGLLSSLRELRIFAKLEFRNDFAEGVSR